MTTEQKEIARKEFETWASAKIGRLWRDSEPGRSDFYGDSHTNLCWMAWLACTELRLRGAP